MSRLKRLAFNTFHSFNDIIKQSKTTIIKYLFDALAQLIPTTKYYQYVINKHKLYTLDNVKKYFKIARTEDIIEYIDEVLTWEKVTTTYLMLSQNVVDNFSQCVDDIKQFINDNHIVLWKLNTVIEDNFEEHLSQLHITDVINAKELNDKDDNIGDDTNVFRVDIGNRDGLFVDIDGEILISYDNRTHNDLVNDYLKRFNQKLNVKWLRPNLHSIKKKADISYIAFGHICNNVYIIDGKQNVSIDNVINDLQNNGISKKIYHYIPRTNDYATVKRLAKK